jgi:hypothetical protein
MNKDNEGNTTTGLEIAVIGMAGRFPGAKNIDEFWDNLKNGVESITFFSNEELLEAGVEPELLENPNYIKAKGVIEDFDCFDSSFFRYTPGEAMVMDPQMRIFHECTWEALEDAGYVPETYEGRIGLYAGEQQYRYHPGASKFDLYLYGEERDGRMVFFLDYSTQLFKQETIDMYIKNFKEVVSQVVENKDVKLQDIVISHDIYDKKIDIPETDFEFQTSS